MSVLRREVPALFLLATLSVAGMAASAPAQAEDDTRRGRAEAKSGDRDDAGRQATGRRERQQDALSDSVRRIERSTRSQVLSAERVPYDGRDINRIKVVDDRGRVRVYMDDPQQSRRGARPTRGDDD